MYIGRCPTLRFVGRAIARRWTLKIRKPGYGPTLPAGRKNPPLARKTQIESAHRADGSA